VTLVLGRALRGVGVHDAPALRCHETPASLHVEQDLARLRARLDPRLAELAGQVRESVPGVLVHASVRAAVRVREHVPRALLSEVRFANCAEALGRMGDFGRLFWNTVLVTVLSIGGQLLTCSLAGYAFARLEFRGRGALLLFVLATIRAVPSARGPWFPEAGGFPSPTTNRGIGCSLADHEE